MLLDKRSKIIEDLDIITVQLQKLLLLKKLQDEAVESNNYSELYEFAENERIIIEDINNSMKILIGDLVTFKNDPHIKKKIGEIDSLQAKVIRMNITLRNNLCEKMRKIEKKLGSLNRFNLSPGIITSSIINIRA
ncbi:MAG: hypothetical protein DRP54_06575 [Spirochaetes bacterium]|nr:MAG: hypothetical protein DRP54_06575 [Spirochaetota bacterium]